MPRHFRATVSKTSCDCSTPPDCPRGERCGRIGSRPRPGPLRAARRTSEPWRMSSGSKPVTTIGTWNPAAIGRYSSMPVIVQTCPAARKPCTRLAGESEHGPHGRRHQHMGDQHGEVVQPQPGRLHHGHGVGRRGGLEAHGEEHHLPLRVLLGQRHGVHRRVDDPHVAAFRLHREQVLRPSRARAACRRTSRRSPPAARRWRRPCRSSPAASRTPGSPGRESSDLARQHLVQAEADDGMGLAAADLHDVPRPRGASRRWPRPVVGPRRRRDIRRVFHGWGSTTDLDPKLPVLLARRRFLPDR